RILPDIENLKYVTPYYFSNATDIFISGYADRRLVFISILVIVLSAGFSVIVYRKRNLSA
ncbi:MAG: ABC transporter permease, partial [Lachnospiraceae bacterium]|nr:ABC transporter permease [Lachnospiraceae bacterium]